MRWGSHNRCGLTKWLVNRNALDIVQEFAVRAEPEQWQEVLVRLTPRNYSISSSPVVSPHEVQLTVSVVRFRGADGGRRGGVCSTFLADRAAAAPVFLQRSPHFCPPEEGGTPIIMVGPGTGIAPFRDQADRVYVQHKMLDYGADVWRWIEEGAHFSGCGDASRMAKDVDAALTAIIRRHGSVSDEDAHDYKRELVASKRYVRDVY